MKAKQYLEQLKKYDILITNKIEEQKQWNLMTADTKSADNNYNAIENDINNTIDKFIKKRIEILSVIEQLDTTEYDILHKMYFGIINTNDCTKKYLYLDDIAEIYNKTYSWATTKHGQALKNVQKILDVKGDTEI